MPAWGRGRGAMSWAGRVSAADFPGPVDVLERIRVPKHFNHRSPGARRDLAAQVGERLGPLGAHQQQVAVLVVEPRDGPHQIAYVRADPEVADLAGVDGDGDHSG